MNDTDLEARLTAMFERRAVAITTVPPIRFSSPAEARTRPSLAPFAVAAAVAAVLLTVGGSVIGIRAIHQNPTPPAGRQRTAVVPAPKPTPTAARACTVNMPQSWQRAIAAGPIPSDHPINNVISTNAGTGDYLVEQVRPATGGQPGQATLAVFNGKAGQDLAQLPGNGTTLPVANGGAAITADWIGYGLHQRGSNNGYDTAMLYNRRTRQSTVLEDLTSAGSAAGGQLNGAPILFDGKAYWIVARYAEHRGIVRTYDLASGTRTSTPVRAAVDLVYYGTGLAIVTQSDLGSALVDYTGTALAPAALRAAVDAAYFTYDGTTLRWWNYTADPSHGILYANWPGTTQVTALTGFSGANLAGVNSWPFVETGIDDPSSPIFDLRSNTRLIVPRGLNVQAVIGNQVLIGTGLSVTGNGGLSLVSLKDLPPAHC